MVHYQALNCKRKGDLRSFVHANLQSNSLGDQYVYKPSSHPTEEFKG